MKQLLIIWVTALFSLVLAQSYTCSANSPCKIGCCGKGGYCGYGPTFCGSGNCTSSCDAKSECDPGWGSQWSSAETCPLNVCCSKYGFCGTTSDFCGNQTVKSPSCSGTSANNRVMGYYESWSVTRPCDQMYPEDIPASAYTHLNFAFAYVDPNSYNVAPMSANDVSLYNRFTGLKQSNPGLQTWISIGGWSMNDADQPTASTFSNLAGSSSAQSAFISSLLQFMSTYGFDGVDIDWEYPVAPERSGKTADFTNYVSFLKNLRQALGSSGHNYGLTITIPSSYWYMQHFDIVNIEPLIDWFNIMTYDLHGTWDSTDPNIGPYVYAHTNLTEIDQTMDLLWRNNIDPNKVTMGLGFYGRSFTLTNPSCTAPGCPFSSGGNPGQCTQNSGTLSYPEIQGIIAAGGATVTLDQAAAVKQVVWDNNQWVSYDDAQTFKLKQNYANSKCLGGTMIWASSLDSSNGSAASALSSTTSLQSKALTAGSTGSLDTLSSCVWSECGANCPSGTSPVAGGGSHPQNSNLGIWQTGCSGTTTRTYCCPNNNKPTCTWRGTAPFCNGKCHNGEVQVATDWNGGGEECWTGHKALCCTSTSSDAANANCTWVGSAPFCAGVGKAASCPSGQVSLTTDNLGSGGDQPCGVGQKSFCCTQPVPYTNCGWYGKSGFLGHLTLSCSDECPSGQYAVAVDPSYCFSGVNKYCCDVPTSIDNPQLASFKSQLQSFASQPTCGTGSYLKRKRDLAGKTVDDTVVDSSFKEALENARDIIGKRASGLSLSDQDVLFQALARIFSSGAQTSLGQAEAQLYNQILEPVWGVSQNDVNNYYNTFPGFDPLSLTYGLACNGGNVSAVVKSEQSDNTALCILPTSVNSNGCGSLPPVHDEFKRGLIARNLAHNGTDSLDIDSLVKFADGYARPNLLAKRRISPSDDTTIGGSSQRPSYGHLLNAIMNGAFTFQYTNVVQIGDSAAQLDHTAGPTDQQQGILEIAWLMADDNNPSHVLPTYMEFDGSEALGPTGRAPPPDIFFVMHLHVDHLLQEGNTQYLGVYAITMFHGQYINGQNRVDSNSVNTGNSRNERTAVLQCPGYAGPQQEDRYVYPNWQVDQNSILSRFLAYLVQNGIVTPQLFQNIATVRNSNYGACTFFDWTNAGSGSPRGANGQPYQRPPGT